MVTLLAMINPSPLFDAIDQPAPLIVTLVIVVIPAALTYKAEVSSPPTNSMF